LKIRLYLDEDAMAAAVTAGLRLRGIDVLTTLEAGLLNQADEDQLAFAASLSRVLYSFNIPDFLRIHSIWSAKGRNHTGIVLAQQRLSRLAEAVPGESMKNRVEFLSRW
jgi:hypothetical protein